ncbi:MAG: OsmC family protein [Terriglobales bacterium]
MANPKEVTQEPKVVNGVNVDELFKTVDAVKTNPLVAKFRFRLGNEWIDGGHNRSTVNEFQGAGQDLQRPQAFTLEADEPPILLGSDKAPNPVEYLLTALAACVTTSMVYHAAARGIRVEEIESQVEGDIDLRGFLGIDKNVRNGFQNIRMNCRIHADISDEQLQELAQLGPTFSPVFDSVTKGVPVSVQAQRMGAKQASGAA